LISKIIFMVFAVGFLLPINYIHAEEESAEIFIDFLTGDIVDLDAGAKMIRADITITNYNPQDGYTFMKVTKLSDLSIIKESEILPNYLNDTAWTVQILHYLDPSAIEDNLLGDYELSVYSEFGNAETIAPFSIIKGSLTPIPIIPQSSGVLELTSEEESEEELELEEVIESKIPAWIHDIFVWYAEGTISEDDLLSALKFLVESDIIVLDN